MTVAEACHAIDYKVYRWTASMGLIDPDGQLIDKYAGKTTTDPAIVLSAFTATTEVTTKHPDGTTTKRASGSIIKNKSVLILQDLHLILKKRDPLITAIVKDAVTVGRNTGRSLMIMGCSLELPPELEKLFTVVNFPMPTRDELMVVAKHLAKDKGVELNGESDDIMDAGVGLTTNEFADAVSASLTEHGCINPSMIAEIKEQTVRKSGFLEIMKPGVTFEQLGGMAKLKSWITKRKSAFSKEAREYGLPMPKGVLLFGVQGAGKSMATRAIASELNVPLIRLDMGRLFGGLVGQSESNVRNAISQIEAFGKCLLWIDEIDKGAAGMVGGATGDSGTTRRVLGTFLTWMAEKVSPVFIVATANDLTVLPPELLRKGRWDEMFFVDLPDGVERKQVWHAQIKMKGRKPSKFNLNELAEATDGWTGAEIEALMGEGLFSAFEANKSEPNTNLLVELSKNTVPLSRTMAEDINRLRTWAKHRCRLA